MKEDQKVEKSEELVNQKPITHVAIPIENLKALFDALKTIEGVSFAKGNEIMDIVRKDNLNVSMAGNPDDVLNPPPGGE